MCITKCFRNTFNKKMHDVNKNYTAKYCSQYDPSCFNNIYLPVKTAKQVVMKSF